MIIDFTEIPPANKGGGMQDLFELFACDFLETIGFTIITRPDRGPDGKKDFFVSETQRGISGETTIKWLVSCKHYASSGKSVRDVDEPDIMDRVVKHDCHGFIGFYSTLPASSLEDKLRGLRNKIRCITYSYTTIEGELLKSNQRDRLLASYFPTSHETYRQQKLQDNNPSKEQNTQFSPPITEDDVLRITKTAIIILELEKIKEDYYSNAWTNKDNVLGKLYRFADHTNEKVADAIFKFLNSVANQTRTQILPDIASSLHSLVLTFFPSSYETDRETRIENGKQCINIGFSLVYDAFIYLQDFRTAEYGLSIWKYVYREGKRNGMPELVQFVLEQYSEIEDALERPEKNDLAYAKELVKVFKNDLKTGDLRFPVLPEHLYKLVLEGDKK